MYTNRDTRLLTIRIIKDRFKRLQRGRLRWLVALVATVQQSLKWFSPILIYVDKDGDWYNHRRDITLVSPELNVSCWATVRAAAEDYWCHGHHVLPGETVVDVGAGIGDDAVVFSRKVGINGRVIAIEAHPSTYRCLLKTIKANKLNNVLAINIAVTDKEGHIAISEEDNFLSNSIQTGTGGRKVQSDTLDNTLQRVGVSQVDLLKMNIEGAETAALNGMTKILHFASNVVVSCHDFKADRGEGTIFRTYERVSEILADAQFQLSRRIDDPRPEVRYYIYGRNCQTLGEKL